MTSNYTAVSSLGVRNGQFSRRSKCDLGLYEAGKIVRTTSRCVYPLYQTRLRTRGAIMSMGIPNINHAPVLEGVRERVGPMQSRCRETNGRVL
jgi:hypothetical protein